MGKPRKPVETLKSEGKSHRTKAEIEEREKAEASFATGIKIKVSDSTRGSEVAHKEFKRIIKLLNKLGKNDGMFEAVINRYCLMTSEVFEMQDKRNFFMSEIDALIKERDNMLDEKFGLNEWYTALNKIYGNYISADRQIMQKRKMLIEIEKENSMTIKSALQSVPLNAPKEKSELEKILGALSDDEDCEDDEDD